MSSGGGNVLGPIGDAFSGLFGGGKSAPAADATELAIYDTGAAVNANLDTLKPEQQKFENNLAAQASGTAPTFIEPLLASNNSKGLQQLLSQARSARGFNPNVVNRNAEVAQAALARQQAQSDSISKLQAQQQQQAAYGDYLKGQQAGLVGQYGGQVAAETQSQAVQQAQQARGDATTGGILNTIGAAAASGAGGAQNSTAPASLTTPSSSAVPSYRLQPTWEGSDRNIKTDIKPKSPSSFLDHLQSYEYKYKKPDMPGAGHGNFVSVMAQDLEKAGPVGRSMVQNTPEGKMVDYGKGFGVMLAAMADLHERQKKLEEWKGGK